MKTHDDHTCASRSFDASLKRLRQRKLIAVLGLLAAVAAASAALAATYPSVRLHSLEVRLGHAPSLQIFSSYLDSATTPCGGNAIYTGDAATMTRFASLATAAQLSGKVLGLWYTKSPSSCTSSCTCTIAFLELQND